MHSTYLKVKKFHCESVKNVSARAKKTRGGPNAHPFPHLLRVKKIIILKALPFIFCVFHAILYRKIIKVTVI